MNAFLTLDLARSPRRDDTDHSVQFALTGTADIGWLNANGENIDATEQKFQAFSPVTLTARPGEGTDWQVDGWDVGGIVRARPSYNDRAEWLQEVKDSLTRVGVAYIFVNILKDILYR